MKFEELTNNESKKAHALYQVGTLKATNFPPGRNDNVASYFEHRNNVEGSISVAMLVGYESTAIIVSKQYLCFVEDTHNDTPR